MGVGVSIQNVHVRAVAEGIYVEATLVFPEGMTVPLRTPVVSYEDIYREGERGIENARAEARRFGKRLKRWLGWGDE